jgi:MFS family permease
MFDLTASNSWVGLMVASTSLPLLFFAIASGALADMFDRAKIMLLAQTIMGGSALAMAILTARNVITPGVLLGLGLLLGTGVALNLPTWQALLPEMVPRDLVASAVALQSAAFNIARAIGPALGGLVYATLGAAAGFGINAITYSFVIGALLMVRSGLAKKEREQTSLGTAILLGLRYARYTPVFRRLLLLVSLFAVTSSVVQSVLPGHNEHIGGNPTTLGVLLGAMGVGALGGTAARQRVMATLGRNALVVTISLFGLAGIGLGLANNLALAAAFMCASGAFWVLTLTQLNATAQLMAPEWIRGRAMSLYTFAFLGILPLGSISSGILADAVGTSLALISISAVCTALGIVVPMFRLPSLDEVEFPEFTRERSATPHDEPVEGGPVMILNTWRIDPSEFNEFAALMSQVRLVRLRTGAYRWRLLRNVSDPTRLTEFFAVGSWEEHLAQHRRIDDASAKLILKARSFDIADGPVTRHLIDIDVADPPHFEALLTTHNVMHQTDGSIPTMDDQDDWSGHSPPRASSEGPH